MDLYGGQDNVNRRVAGRHCGKGSYPPYASVVALIVYVDLILAINTAIVIEEVSHSRTPQV